MSAESNGDTWVVILAAGEGTRLSSLTTMPSGVPIPKQFCSLLGGPSLLHETLLRARRISPYHHVCAVVAKHHRRWWQSALRDLPADNVFVQPRNRGTAIGMLLALLHILRRDPRARVVMLPADHHVQQESVLHSALLRAVDAIGPESAQTLLLGMTPEQADSQLGYIVPGNLTSMGVHEVERFVEKPPFEQAHELVRGGALWNAFIVVSSVQDWLDLLRRRIHSIVCDLAMAIDDDCGSNEGQLATTALYENLISVDFSHDILPGQEARLRVLPVPPCGWSDLGTPQRVAEVLERIQAAVGLRTVVPLTGYMDLSIEHAGSLRARAGGVDVTPR